MSTHAKIGFFIGIALVFIGGVMVGISVGCQ